MNYEQLIPSFAGLIFFVALSAALLGVAIYIILGLPVFIIRHTGILTTREEECQEHEHDTT